MEQLRLRDERVRLVELDVQRITEDYRRLREDVLPALRLAKDAQQPLPNTSQFESAVYPPSAPPSSTLSVGGGQSSGGLGRQFSARKITVGPSASASKNGSSPTHLQMSHERSALEQSLDPQAAAERAVVSS